MLSKLTYLFLPSQGSLAADLDRHGLTKSPHDTSIDCHDMGLDNTEHDLKTENKDATLQLLESNRKQIEDLASRFNHYEGENNGNWKLAAQKADAFTKRLEAEVSFNTSLREGTEPDVESSLGVRSC